MIVEVLLDGRLGCRRGRRVTTAPPAIVRPRGELGGIPASSLEMTTEVVVNRLQQTGTKQQDSQPLRIDGRFLLSFIFVAVFLGAYISCLLLGSGHSVWWLLGRVLTRKRTDVVPLSPIPTVKLKRRKCSSRDAGSLTYFVFASSVGL